MLRPPAGRSSPRAAIALATSAVAPSRRAIALATSAVAPAPRAIALAASAVALAGSAVALCVPAVARAAFAPAGSLGPCDMRCVPQVVFPASSPNRASGPGALVWGAGSSALAASLAGDTPGRTVRLAAPSGAPAAATGTTAGTLALALPGPSGLGLTEGRLPPPLSAARPLRAQAAAASSGYLGDAAVVTAGPTGLFLRRQRWFTRRFASPVRVRGAGAAVGSLAVALDYRSDALVVWTQGRSTFARWISQDDVAGPQQRLGPATAGERPSAVLSDDDRAMVAWTLPGRGLELSISGPGVSFGHPRVIDAQGTAVRLARLSKESVVMAWSDGDGTLRAAHVSLSGPSAAVTVSLAGEQATLGDLASGPDNDFVLAWTGAGGLTVRFSRGRPTGAGLSFSPPETVATGAEETPAVGVDPADDRAVVAWGSMGELELAAELSSSA